jgi:hypothetical protein
VFKGKMIEGKMIKSDSMPALPHGAAGARAGILTFLL